MNNQDIKEFIQNGESLWCEFKREIPKQAGDLGKEMVAFANAEGGVLLIGVEDNGTIIGVDKPNEMMERLSGIANKGCDLRIKPEIGMVSMGETVSVVYVSISACPIATYKGRIYQRIGNIAEELDTIGINELANRLNDNNKPPQLGYDYDSIVEHPKSELISAYNMSERNSIIGMVIFFVMMLMAVLLPKDVLIYSACITMVSLAVFGFLFIYPYSYEKMLYNKMPKILGEGMYLGDGKMLVNHSEDSYFISKPFTKCPKPHCEGNIVLDDCPPREREHRTRTYVGRCSTTGWDHSYEIDSNFVATPTKFDRRPLETKNT